MFMMTAGRNQAMQKMDVNEQRIPSQLAMQIKRNNKQKKRGELATTGFIYNDFVPKSEQEAYNRGISTVRMSEEELTDLITKYNDGVAQGKIKGRLIDPLMHSTKEGGAIISDALQEYLSYSEGHTKEVIPKNAFQMIRAKERNQLANRFYQEGFIDEDTFLKIKNKELKIHNFEDFFGFLDVNDQAFVERLIGKAYYKNAMYKQSKSIKGDIDIQYDPELGAYVASSLTSPKIAPGAKLLGGYGGFRGSATMLPNAFFDFMQKELGLDRRIDAITENKTKYDLRSAPQEIRVLIESILERINTANGGNRQQTGQTFLQELEKRNLQGLAKAFKLDKDGRLISDLKVMQTELFSSEDALKQAIVGLDAWNAELLNMTSYFVSSGENMGKVQGKVMAVIEALGVRNDINYGSYDVEEGSAKTFAMKAPLERMVGSLVANGAMNQKEGQELAQILATRISPTEDRVKRFEQIKQEVEEAQKTTLASENSNFQIPDKHTAGYISIGFGDDYDINLDTIEEEMRDQKTNRITNKEKTIDLLFMRFRCRQIVSITL